MKAREVIEEILSKVFRRHSFPVSLKANAVLLYFKELSLRAVREFSIRGFLGMLSMKPSIDG